MNTREKLIKARLGMLALAEELQNISWACRRAGISRSHFYEVKEAFERYGAEGVAPRIRRSRRFWKSKGRRPWRSMRCPRSIAAGCGRPTCGSG
jgi:hypothetical protein